MDPLVTRIFTLLVTDTGSLAYHFILAFSTFGALQIALISTQSGSSIQRRRLVAGLSILFGMQFGAFVFSGLGWQGVFDSQVWLPQIDRAVLLLSTLLVIWLWISDRPSSTLDAAAFLLALLCLTAAVLGVLGWGSQQHGVSFNHTTLDIAAQIAVLVLAALGLALLLIRRPPGWILAVSMLVVQSLGPALHLVLPPLQGDYSGYVRLSVITAYPFLLFLPLRYGGRVGESTITSEKIDERATPRSDDWIPSNTQFWQSLTRLVLETDPDQVCKEVVSALAQAAQADLCLMAKPIEEEGVIVLNCGFDQVHGRYFEKEAIPIKKLPLFTASFKMGRTRRIRVQSSTPDLVNLTRILNLESSGNVLFLPVLTKDGHPITSLIFMSPHTQKDWTAQEQSTLHQYARALVQIMQRNQEMVEVQDKFDRSQQVARLAQEQVQSYGLEQQKLQDQLVVLQEEIERDNSQTVNLGIITADQASTQQLIKELETEIERLRSEAHANAERGGISGNLDGDLRLALEEVAVLRSQLVDTERRLEEYRSGHTKQPTIKSNPEILSSIAGELQETLGSIINNSEELKETGKGDLNPEQRKHLDRIRVSASRLKRLVSDLIKASNDKGWPGELELSEFDFIEILKTVIQDHQSKIRDRGILLDLITKEEPIRVFSDVRTVSKVMTDLLKNSIAVTPEGEQLQIRVQHEHTEGQPDFVLLQVADSGAGIDDDNLPKIFFAPAADAPIQGIGHGEVDFAALKAMVERLEGRIWADSEVGQGTVFNFLLPVAPKIPYHDVEPGGER